MNPFYLTWMVFFTLYCSSSSQSDPLGPVLNGTDSEHRIRCDTYSPVHEINYIWTIRQFSHLEALNTSAISSPKLHALTTDKYEWLIQFLPNYIHKEKETISVIVWLTGGSRIREALLDLNISIINHKEETLLKRSSPQSLLAGGGRGWRPYCKKDDFFRHHLLQNDTLTLLINIRWLSQLCNNVSHERNPSPTPIHETTNFLQSEPSKNTDSEYMIRCDTFMQFHEIKYLWTIHHFSYHETLNTSGILSPKLHAPTTNKYEWDIKITPNHIHEGNKTIAVYVYLSGGSTIREAVADLHVSIINQKKETLFYKNSTRTKYSHVVYWGWDGYCNKDDFFRHHLLQNDTLMLLINIKWLSPHCNNVSHEREIPPPTPIRYIYTGKCENLAKLADELFVAASKYGLDDLRKICEQRLCETLSAEKAEDMFVFAKKHHANELKFKAAQFIANRFVQKLNITG
ncbi:uncharacterized protein LOC135846753 [Planococcus citri]|uniref:uncharacterized protein LOC135846753 n=1 Tax=Planococcus citri TaxID=170843 RepID=UPI0031F9EB55